MRFSYANAPIDQGSTARYVAHSTAKMYGLYGLPIRKRDYDSGHGRRLTLRSLLRSRWVIRNQHQDNMHCEDEDEGCSGEEETCACYCEGCLDADE